MLFNQYRFFIKCYITIRTNDMILMNPRGSLNASTLNFATETVCNKK